MAGLVEPGTWNPRLPLEKPVAGCDLGRERRSSHVCVHFVTV